MERILDSMCQETGKDREVLRPLVEEALQTCLNVCNYPKMDDKIRPIVHELALIYFNHRGLEGEKKRKEGSLEIDYDSAPEMLKQNIRAVRRPKIGL